MRKNIYILFLLSLCICYGNAERQGPIFGGETEQDPRDPIYQTMAEEVVHSYLHVKEQLIKKITIIKVTTQLVAGTITKLQFRVLLDYGKESMCNAEIWEQPWENIKHVTYDCDSLFSKKQLSAQVNSRPEQLRDPNNPKYRKLANLLLDTYLNSPGNKLFKKEDVKLLSVITAKVKLNSQIGNSLLLDVKTDNKGHFQCAGYVLETPWKSTNTAQVTDIKCHKKIADKAGAKLSHLQGQEGKNQQIGGQEVQDSKDPKYTQLAKESFQKYRDDHIGLLFTVKELKVTKVTTQLVSGVITLLDFQAIPTKGKLLQCHSEIFEKSWEQIKDITVTCTPQRSLKLSSGFLAGGELKQDPNRPEYKKLAEESFEKYRHDNISVPSEYVVKKLLVTKVTTQVVAGIVTRLDFKIMSTKGNSLQCHSTILEQSWLHNKNIKVNCFSPAESKNALSGGKKKLGQGLQDTALDSYFAKIDTTGLWRVEQKYLISSKTITTRVGKQEYYYYKSNVLVSTSSSGEYNIFNCSEVFEAGGNPNPIGVNCVKQTRLLGRSDWIDPTDEDLQSYAEKALQKYSERPNNYLGAKGTYDIIMTFATKGVVAGWRYDIDFIVRSVGVIAPDLNCHAVIIEELTNTLTVNKVNCNQNPNQKVKY